MTDETSQSNADDAQPEDGERRDFIRKLPWVAPAIQTFLVSEDALAQGKGNKGKGQGNKGQGKDRRQSVSPHPGRGKKAPPPPPPAAGRNG